MRLPDLNNTLGFFVLVLVILAGSTPAYGQYGFPVKVTNPTNHDRVDTPILTSISVPISAPIINPGASFELVDDAGNEIPVQFKILSRWHGLRDDATKKVKWVLMEFLGSVPANSSRTYFVRNGTPMNGSVTHTDAADSVVINTGGAAFTLDKTNFTLFSQVVIDSQNVLGSPGSLDIRNMAGAPVSVTLTSTEFEETGTVRTVVKQKGDIPTLGLQFTARYYFWSGQTDVKVDFRLENDGAYGELTYTGLTSEHGYFEDLKLTVNIGDNLSDVATSGGTHDTNGAQYSLEQKYGVPNSPLEMLTGFEWDAKVAGTQVAAGDRHDGALALNGSSGSVAVAVDRFWQNFPKSLEASGNALSVGLWPAFGNGPEFSGQYGIPGATSIDGLSDNFYRFEGGRWKTHTIHVDFKGTGTFQAEELAAMAVRANKPLLGRAENKNWNFRNFAFGDLLVERRSWTMKTRNRYEQLCDILVHDSAADFQSTLGKVGFPQFRNRGGTYGGNQFYGWENFGDIVWGDGYSSLHYDMPYGVLVNWFRTGDYAFFDVGRDMAVHRRDYDQLHSNDPNSLRRGGQFYEKGWFHGNYQAPTPSHTWVHGMLLHYIITGDEGSYEAAIEAGEFVARQHPESWDGYWGSRILGWQVELLTNLYNYIGDTQYTDLAKLSIQNWESHEAAYGQGGFVLNPGFASNPHSQTWMHAIVLNSLAKYFLATFDFSVFPCIDRMAGWMLNEAIMELPSGPPTNRTLGRIWTRWKPGWASEPSRHHGWAISSSLSWAGLILSRPEYMDASIRLNETMTLYHQISSGSSMPQDTTDPNSWSVIAFRMMAFPNSESKVMGNIAMWGHAPLAARLIWSGQF